MDNEEADMVHYHLEEEDNFNNDDTSPPIQSEKTPIQKLFMYSYSIFLGILLLCILYLLYKYFTKNTNASPIPGYNQPSNPNINIIPENDRVYISNMLDNFIKNGS